MVWWREGAAQKQKGRALPPLYVSMKGGEKAEEAWRSQWTCLESGSPTGRTDPQVRIPPGTQYLHVLTSCGSGAVAVGPLPPTPPWGGAFLA